MTTVRDFERYADAAIAGVLRDLADTRSGRNDALNLAAVKMGGFVAHGATTTAAATEALFAAAVANGHVAKHGRAATLATIRSGLSGGKRSPRAFERPSPVAEGLHTRHALPTPSSVLEHEAGQGESYPPAAEVRAVWDSALRVDQDPAASAYLRDARCIDPVQVSDLDVARVVPRNAGMPAWAGFGKEGRPWRSWPSVGLTLALPLYDASGAMRSLLFRRTFDVDGNWPPKSVSAKGARKGLAMMCPLARQVVQARALPSWWPSAELRVIVAEGEADFLTACGAWSDAAECAPACTGGFTGSWSLLEALPAGCTVAVRTDADEPGAKHATAIVNAVRERWFKGELAIDLPDYFALRGESVVLAC